MFFVETHNIATFLFAKMNELRTKSYTRWKIQHIVDLGMLDSRILGHLEANGYSYESVANRQARQNFSFWGLLKDLIKESQKNNQRSKK